MVLIKQKSHILLPLLMAAVFLVSGCVNQTTETETAVSGTEGLVLNFFPGTPPASLGEGDIFEVGLTVENRGAHMIPANNATVYLRGVNPNNFRYGDLTAGQSPVGKDNSQDLISAQIIEGQVIGGQDTLFWSDLCYEVDLNTDQTVNFIAQSCYLYNATTRFDACFNENPYKQTTGSETCSAQGSKTPVNSNAPIQVTSISQSPAGKGKYRFIIELSNLGSGKVYDQKKLGTACTNASVQHFDRVHIDSITMGAKDIDFTNPKFRPTWLGGTTNPNVKLVNGLGQFSFTYEPEFLTSIYTEPISIKFSYGYTADARASVRISAIPEVNARDQCALNR